MGHTQRQHSVTCHTSCLLLLAATLLLLLAPAAVNGELVLVYSIQRHGARNVLPKSALLTESDATGGPTLLPAGQQMCIAAGTAFNRRYISQATCAAARPSTCLSTPGSEAYGVANTRGVGFSNYNSFANSSALDRTIMSADSFLSGVFPPTDAAAANSRGSLQAVPVYSISDSEDWRIRGYAKCPAYQQRLSAWLRSDDFKQKEQESQALREQVQALAPQLNVSLPQWWDVYDSFNVWRTYGVGSPMAAIDNATFAEVVDLAMWLETSKMDPQLTGNVLGGGLLGDMLARMAAAEAAATSGAKMYYKLLTVSAHYNTQLGVLAALQAGADPSRRTHYLWQQRIPSLAAVLAFELHRSPDGATFVVRAVFQDGPRAQYSVLPLPCAVAGDAADELAGPGSCTLDRFRALAGPQAINSSADFCEACSNTKVMACVVRNMERQLMAVGSSRRSGTSPGMVAVWCVVSVALAAMLAGAALLVARKLRQRRQSTAQQLLRHASGPVSSLDQPAPV